MLTTHGKYSADHVNLGSKVKKLSQTNKKKKQVTFWTFYHNSISRYCPDSITNVTSILRSFYETWKKNFTAPLDFLSTLSSNV